MAKRGDAELASAMRRLLEDDENVDISWSREDGFYILSFNGTVNLEEEEAEIMIEVMGE